MRNFKELKKSIFNEIVMVKPVKVSSATTEIHLRSKTSISLPTFNHTETFRIVWKTTLF